MLQNQNLELLINGSNLVTPLREKAEVIQAELAERSLKQQLFGHLASSDLAQTVAWEMVSMLRLSLETGNLYQFQRQIDWEIKGALSRHQLHKLNADLLMLDLLQDALLHHLDASLEPQIKILVNQLRQLFQFCWTKAEQAHLPAAALN